MKKHNGHSQNQVKSQARTMPGGLQAALAKNIARALARDDGPSGTRYPSGVRVAKGKGGTGAKSAGINAALEDTYIKVLGGTAASASGATGTPYAVAIGSGANAVGAIAIGSSAFATRQSTDGLNYYDYSGLAIGNNAKSYAKGVALGLNANASGLYGSVALGSDCSATGSSSAAIGDSATTTGDYAVALGTSANASTNGSVALGSGTTAASASGWSALAVGQNCHATGDAAAALGNGGNATGYGALAVGRGALANADRALAMGTAANATDTYAIAIGSGANASNSYGIAIQGTASGDHATAIGSGASAGAQYAAAIGQQAAVTAAANNSVALGYAANASAANAVALGASSAATEANTISVSGSKVRRKIVNMEPGIIASTSTDAVNGSQLYGTAHSVASALDGNSVVNADGTLSAPSYPLVNGGTQNNVGAALDALDGALTAIGDQVKELEEAGLETLHYFKAEGPANGSDDADASGDKAVAIGSNADASADGAIAIGQTALALADGAIAIGVNANPPTNKLHTNSIAIGTSTTAGYPGTVAIGNEAASAQNSVAVGDAAKARNKNDTAIGAGATASFDATAIGQAAAAISGSTAIGVGATTIASSNAVALGAHSSTTRNDTVAVGAVGSERQIVNLAPGTQGKDAVNVNQLKPMVAAFGGGASIDPSTGAVTGPTYTFANGDQYTTLQAALSALDEATTEENPYLAVNSTGPNARASGSDAIALGSNTNATGDNAIAIGKNSLADVDDTVSFGNITLKRKLVNVAPGVVSPVSTDAINGSQLYDTNQQLSALQNTWDNSGLIDPKTGTLLAVTYSNPSKSLIVLGSVGSPVEILNVAPGIQPTDAVNLTQLTDAVDELRSEISNGTPYVKVNSTGAVANAIGQDAIAIGLASLATVADATAMGARARASATQSVAIGSDSLADTPMTVSIGNAASGVTRRLVSLQAGITAADAVNVSQLKPMVTALGGGASIDPSTGAVTGPTYDLVNGGTQTTLQGALYALDQAVSNGSGANNPYLAV
ncbi:hypothetical protein DWU98_20595, partial [Dyella monticola]